MPNILFVLHIPPPVHGAAMVGKFIKDSSSINTNFNTKFINLGTSKTVDDIGKSGFSKILRYFILLWKVVVQMIIFRPQTVYLTLTAKGTGFYKDSIIALLVKILGGNTIYHFHNKGVQTRQHKPFDNWLYKKVFNRSDLILLSEYLYSDVEKYVSRERVYICPNGIPDQISSNVEEQIESEEGPVQLFFLSNLIESKGIFVLLEACKLLKSKSLYFTCVFVGGEGDITGHQLNKKIKEFGLEEEVIYAGKKYNEEKEAVFAESDIFAFPTHYPNECFPLVLLEAMQSKLPIISTPEGGIPSMVEEGENGFLVPQKDAKALAGRLEELIINTHKRKEMGEKGYKKYQESFTLQAFEERFTRILQTLSEG